MAFKYNNAAVYYRIAQRTLILAQPLVLERFYEVEQASQPHAGNVLNFAKADIFNGQKEETIVQTLNMRARKGLNSSLIVLYVVPWGILGEAGVRGDSEEGRKLVDETHRVISILKRKFMGDLIIFGGICDHTLLGMAAGVLNEKLKVALNSDRNAGPYHMYMAQGEGNRGKGGKHRLLLYPSNYMRV